MYPFQRAENNSASFMVCFLLNTMFLHLCLCPRASRCPMGTLSQVPLIFITFVSCGALAPTQKLLLILLLEGP